MKFGQFIIRKNHYNYCHQMSHYEAKMHRIRFPASVRPSVCSSHRWSLTLTVMPTSDTIHTTAIKLRRRRRFVRTDKPVADPKISKAGGGGAAEDNVSAPSSFIANTICLLYGKRRLTEYNSEPIRGGGAPIAPPL